MGGAWRPGGYPISQGIWTLFSFASAKFLGAVGNLIFFVKFSANGDLSFSWVSQDQKGGHRVGKQE